MKSRLRSIPQFDLSPQAKTGVLVWPIQDRSELENEHPVSAPHRDSHYLLLLTTDGQFTFSLDFEEVAVMVPALVLICPGQVHQMLTMQGLQGWAVSFDAALLESEMQQLLETGLRTPRLLDQQAPYYAQAVALLHVFRNIQAAPATAYTARTTQALLTALLNLTAGWLLAEAPTPERKQRRGPILEQAFQQLLTKHYKTWKQPAHYAAALAVSVAHLHDVVKSLTGTPPSIHIQQYAIREAKRLLCFTDWSVKEISYAVGYEEPVHFNRLFRKVAGCTPLYFRQQFRA
jgi:AraC family transcriptional activator of pobA